MTALFCVVHPEAVHSWNVRGGCVSAVSVPACWAYTVVVARKVKATREEVRNILDRVCVCKPSVEEMV